LTPSTVSWVNCALLCGTVLKTAAFVIPNHGLRNVTCHPEVLDQKSIESGVQIDHETARNHA